MWLVLLTLTWGTLAFGAVYPWAFTILSVIAAVVGVAGLVAGTRTLGDSRWILAGLGTIGLVGLLQLVPLGASTLEALSPGTYTFLTRYDLRYLMATAGAAPGAPASPPAHAISVAPAATWTALALLAAFTLFLGGTLRTLSRVSAIRVALSMTALGAVLAVIGIVQYVALGDHAFAGMRIYGIWRPESLLTTPFGPFVNKNHFAGCMVMLVPLALTFVLSEYEQMRSARIEGLRSQLIWLSGPGGGRALLCTLALLLMTLALLMTRSRSGLAALALIGLAMTGVVTRRFESRRLGGLLAIAFGALGLLMILWAGQYEVVRGAQEASSFSMRLAIWRDALAIARDFPLLGSGLNTFGTATMRYQTTGATHYNEAHNDYVQLLAEGGLVLAVVILALMVLLVRAIHRRFLQNRDLTDVYWLRVGATTALVAIAVQAAVEFSLQMPGNAAIFVVLLALALYAPQRRSA